MPEIRHQSVDGFFAIFKPSGLSSATALNHVKHELHADKAGFLGTLDVAAMGVLPVAVGRATRLIAYLPATPKEYVGELVLGMRTVTDDTQGAIVARCATGGLYEASIVEAMESVAARVSQVPPHVSAKHREGVRGYTAMRQRGELLDFEPQPVVVHTLLVLLHRTVDGGRRVHFRMTVAPGFYVRSFCRDVGDELGVGACMGSLVRTRAHGYGVTQAMALSKLARRVADGDYSFVSSGEANPALLGTLPRLELSELQADAFRHGLHVVLGVPDAEAALVYAANEFLGVARVDGGTIRPLRVMM